MVDALLEAVFPKLQGQSYQITSPRDDRYNCIAWAAGQKHQWWWPDEAREDNWPQGIPRVVSLEAFRQAFGTLGYFVCDDEQLEPSQEKIAVFAVGDLPKHAARQLSSGRWTSKLGPMEDVEHALRDLEGEAYGLVALIMKRPRPSTGS